MPRLSTPRVRLRLKCHICLCIVLVLYVFCSIRSCNSYKSRREKRSGVNLATGPVSHEQSSSFDFTSFVDAEESKPKVTNVLTGPISNIQTKTDLILDQIEAKKADKRLDGSVSMDCIGKRREILRKHRTSKHVDTAISPSYQKLRPKHNESLEVDASFDSEHVPQCTSDGMYERIQCHQIGYCWCVNKFGQAIKNSATLGEKPFCDMNMYESESNNLLVVTGVSAHRIKGILKGGSQANPGSALSAFSSVDSDSDFNHQDQDQGNREPEDEFSRRVSTSQEPSLALVPNECTLSRDNAIQRASKHSDDSIWIPDCDSRNQKLYAEKQCHKMTVCWCVDQGTGLPLRTNEQLTKQTTINCTEIKRIIDMASSSVKQNSHKTHSSFFNGFSESCDADKRVKFVLSLINQFRKQISEYMELNPSHAIPEGLKSENPYELSESETSIWKFSTLDQDLNGKLDDREWSRFKVHFKLVDKIEDRSNRPETSKHFSPIPLSIIRAQRRCWRDFLQFCGGGDILSDESITLAKWLSCTEVPNKLISDRSHSRIAPAGSAIIPDAYTRAAAIARSRRKNPFLGILKPD